MALHVTQCPGCESTFNTNARMLQSAAGRVRCGSCLMVFEAIDNFVETNPIFAAAGGEESVFVGNTPNDYFDPSRFLTRSALTEVTETPAETATRIDSLLSGTPTTATVDSPPALAEFTNGNTVESILTSPSSPQREFSHGTKPDWEEEEEAESADQGLLEANLTQNFSSPETENPTAGHSDFVEAINSNPAIDDAVDEETVSGESTADSSVAPLETPESHHLDEEGTAEFSEEDELLNSELSSASATEQESPLQSPTNKSLPDIEEQTEIESVVKQEEGPEEEEIEIEQTLREENHESELRSDNSVTADKPGEPDKRPSTAPEDMRLEWSFSYQARPSAAASAATPTGAETHEEISEPAIEHDDSSNSLANSTAELAEQRSAQEGQEPATAPTPEQHFQTTAEGELALPEELLEELLETSSRETEQEAEQQHRDDAVTPSEREPDTSELGDDSASMSALPELDEDDEQQFAAAIEQARNDPGLVPVADTDSETESESESESESEDDSEHEAAASNVNTNIVEPATADDSLAQPIPVDVDVAEPEEDSTEAIRARALEAELEDDQALEAIPEENLSALGDVSTPLELIAKRDSKWLRQLSFTLAILLLSTSMVGQFLWQRMDLYAQSAQLRQFYLLGCRWLDCELPIYSEIKAIRSDNLAVRTHPDVDNGLMVSVAFRNSAAFPQPFPILILSFNTPTNEVVALREFSPAEYLPAAIQSVSLMPVNRPIQINLEVIDPGPDAVNYTLAFRRPSVFSEAAQ